LAGAFRVIFIFMRIHNIPVLMLNKIFSLNVLPAFRAMNPNPNAGDFDVKIANDGRAKLIIGVNNKFVIKINLSLINL
jgi:hypothetical protein